MTPIDWMDDYITLDDSGQFNVLNHDQSDTIGQFDRYDDAVEFLIAYARGPEK